MMMIALKTLKRKKLRTVLTVGGVSIAVAVLVGLLGFDTGYHMALQSDIDKMGYQVLITAKGCPYEAATLMMKGGGGLRYMDETVYNKIISDERIDKVSPQLMSTVFSSDKGEIKGGGVSVYIGVADSYLKMKPWMTFKSGGWFSSTNSDEVVMGYEAAELEQRKIGDEIYIPEKDKVLKVVGIFTRSGSQDDGMIFMPLASAQRVFDLGGKLTGIGIKLKDIGKMKQFEEDLYAEPAIQVISMAQVKGTIFNLISSAKALTNSIAAIAAIIAIIGVMNTILMSVFERTKEIGVMKALGASRMDIFRIVWMETTLICLFGGIIGDIVAISGGSLIEMVIKSILPYAPTGKLVVITPALLAYSVIGAIVTGLISGIYPAWRASSMKPVEAIRSVG